MGVCARKITKGTSIKNQIINYFIVNLYNGKRKVFRAPLTMSASTAKSIISKYHENIKSGLLLHACYDLDSSILYLTNAQEFTSDQIKQLLPLVKERIGQDFSKKINSSVIIGSPFSTLRVTNISNFQHIYKYY